ncbi:MAG: fumarylacetoacetate hydrolase family protein [Candidatus Marinimicrobia bacterium]|nr:fumarylacetoacetate hydrolase family protein [Candidatus Neomarinimicrobiota bacterium]
MDLPFQPTEKVLLPIHGSDALFPVNQVYCVGRNYAAHAREMGVDDRKPPFFFTKPSWTITTGDVKYPPNTEDFQHEVELVLAVGEDVSIFGFAVGVDLTRRDIQGRAKENGKPWFSGKSFVGSAPISEIIPIKGSEDLSDLELTLKVNGELRQSGSCSDMIWTPPEILCEMVADIPLSQGDLIFSGTPAGVGRIQSGDMIEATIPDRAILSFSII